MNDTQPTHVAFIDLPKKDRELAYKAVRTRVGPGTTVTVSEMLKAHAFLQEMA